MEDKKTNGQQAEQPAKGTQEQKQAPSAWLEKVTNQINPLGEELNATKGEERGLVVIAIDHTTPKGAAFIGIAGGSLPLADAMKIVLTSKHFAKHITHAALLMAEGAAQTGKETIVIHASEPQDDEEQEATEKEGEEAPADE